METQAGGWVLTASDIVSRIKRITWMSDAECDILIYDAAESRFVQYCMPPQAKVNVLTTREGLPLIKSIPFFLQLFFGLLKYRKLSFALVSALLRTWKPKIIVTYIDNSPELGKIKQIFPSAQTVAIQNGTRWDLSRLDQPHLHFDHYFSFGWVEKDILSCAGHVIGKIYPVGSVRAGVFREKHLAASEKEFDICFISQFESLAPVWDKQWWVNQRFAYHETAKKLFCVVTEFAEKNNLKLCIAMRSSTHSPEFEEEYQYFALGKNKSITCVTQSPFSSYKAVQKSRLSVTLSSTLGYEVLGLGERIIFAKDLSAVAAILQERWGENLATQKLPELQRLHTLDYDEFAYKANEILGMTEEKYADYSKEARAYYMNIGSEQPPHEIIKSTIAGLLSPADTIGSINHVQ